MAFTRALLTIIGSSVLISTSAFSLLPVPAPRNVAARSATTMSLSRREALFAGIGVMVSQPLSVFAADDGNPKVPASELIKPRADACTQVLPLYLHTTNLSELTELLGGRAGCWESSALSSTGNASRN